MVKNGQQIPENGILENIQIIQKKTEEGEQRNKIQRIKESK